ncbi:MAG: hypothetical protein GY820_44655, partial [Gammaproteobacteria bacterium]|nr:hypothetical protein [Gammaproteobacteria bacterium]
MKRFVQSAEGGAEPQHYPQSAEGGRAPLSGTVGKSQLGPHPNADLQHLSVEQLGENLAVKIIQGMGISEQNAQKAVSDYKQGYLPEHVDPKTIPLPPKPPLPPGPPLPSPSVPSTPQRKVVLKPESTATPGYPGFDHTRAVGLAQGGASFTPSIAPSGPPTARVQPVPMDTTTQKGSASVPQTPTTSAASSSWGVPRGDPPFPQQVRTGWQAGGWNVPAVPRRISRKPVVALEIPRPIILTR